VLVGAQQPQTPPVQVKNDHLYIVVNAGCREKDLAHLGKHLSAFKARTCARAPTLCQAYKLRRRASPGQGPHR